MAGHGSDTGACVTEHDPFQLSWDKEKDMLGLLQDPNTGARVSLNTKNLDFETFYSIWL